MLALATSVVMLLVVGCAPRDTTDDEVLFGSHTDLTGPIAFFTVPIPSTVHE